MKPHIKDKLWTQLSELPTRDVGKVAADRIRARSLDALAASPSDLVAWSRRIERFWTDFLELPMIGVVMAACFSWAVHGMASAPTQDDRHATLASTANLERDGEFAAPSLFRRPSERRSCQRSRRDRISPTTRR